MLAALHFQYFHALPRAFAVLAVLVLLILLTYPSQIRHIPASKRWILPALRIMAVSAIVLSILRPVITRPRLSAERAPVLIAFDDSRSMGVIDSARSPAELVSIAAALGQLPPDTRDAVAEGIQADCDLLSTRADEVSRARAELDYARLSGRGESAASARLDQAVAALQSIARDALTRTSETLKTSSLEKTLAYLAQLPTGMDKQIWLDRIRDKARAAAADAERFRLGRDAELFSSNEKVRDACKPLQSLSRLNLAQRIVFDADSGLLFRLGVETPVSGFGISDRVTPVSLSVHDSTYQPLDAEGSISNLTGGIRTILDSMSADPPRAVVLFSDGRQSGADLEMAATAARGVPVFTVGAASRSGLKDLSIQNASVASTAWVGEPFVFKADVRAVGFTQLRTTATITGGGPDETRSITFDDDRNAQVQFSRVINTPGNYRIALEVPSAPGEVSCDNNRIERWITIHSPADTPRPVSRQKQSPYSAASAPPATRPAWENEMADLTGDEGTLRRLAESTGGQFFRLDQLDALVRRVNEIQDDANHPIEVPLWDGPYLVAGVLGCLAAEWGLRKRFGLA